MRILLFGRNGQVGWELQRSLAPLGEVVALGSSPDEGGLCGDFGDLDGLARTVAQVRPDAIVNAAAYTAVDKAESETERARLVNALAPGVLAQAAHRIGAALVHYSSDYVFDGSGSRPWTEADGTGPLNVYGGTKLEGEQRIAQAQPWHLVLRTSWVYGARGGNFARTMLRLARERERLTVIDDQFGAPTGADLLADATAHALRSLLADPELAGTYHVAAAGQTSWHGYARFVIGQAQQAGAQLRASADAVDAVPTAAFPTPARRPHNSRLDTGRFRATFRLALPPWEQGVARMLREIS
ncbi:MAG: dTDP-4-dehydrorhamnose reductase [Ramlibacter sp.]|jgi:dTDP-4-dehydrorhamnose reductase|uniref:dTDP-4-dehydrorhamnose reductase n=1 Tax=Ramlibacter sp. TaxID=1917967 RepID=UPI002626B82B|nr:dTDP-4-dehydrorhamnose reductase [Ramlibacter sp.]MDB5750579.1 dTDP-4-dehydrorhamnose reductase [Ramlibacter sp.]